MQAFHPPPPSATATRSEKNNRIKLSFTPFSFCYLCNCVQMENDNYVYSSSRCLFHGLEITENVNVEKEKLMANRDSVLEKVEATNKTKRVNDAVWEWLKDAEKLIEEEKKLETELEKAGSSNCLRGPFCFLDSKRRYKLFSEMLKKIKMLNTKCEFEPFSIPIPGLEYFSSIDFVCFDPQKKTMDQLMAALEDDSIHIIGLYGKQGSGKTKLVEAVGKKAKYLRIFNKVIFATVPQNGNIVRQIQDQIADSLDLTFQRYSEVARANAISSEIESNRLVLVILDDVRARLERKDIGIPINGKWCKVLFTTRSQQECTLMDCQREIPLLPLFEEEAWTLLKKHSYIDDESSFDLLSLARELANECQGLPRTIKEVGSSLKSQPIEEWKTLLYSLRHSARYQIFISFRGGDTRHSFTGFLYDALCREGFKTFMDDGELECGDQISQTLINAIEASRLSIIVLSENYAKSAWCLDELDKILECMTTKNQLVWPIFYKVEPSDVRYQKNSYGEAMVAHENRFVYDSEMIQNWRSALFKVAGLSGMTYSTGYEYKFIQTIVERAKNNKNRLFIQSTDME
ncbi:disease resistance protein RUN1-like [Lotus japonicus]|uniref:disease resistance protein RUN1-like n=1 Tax=Lotus japonicus TaxID=34305 RepID=UPI00258B0A0B|nr:disease resistance protein RUN1-like [Lotus japonicus]